MMTLKYSCLALTVLVLLSSVIAQDHGQDEESEGPTLTGQQMFEMKMMEKVQEIQALEKMEEMKQMELTGLQEIEAMEDMALMVITEKMTGPGSPNEELPMPNLAVV
ncbi:unnamed protein product [Knipowitschia caucasica]|uniref:Uncharacterized protein n=1 Tax=Knipowitschia caucasica TaxID=637954 RepID=A0AAV2LY21_KNICA